MTTLQIPSTFLSESKEMNEYEIRFSPIASDSISEFCYRKVLTYFQRTARTKSNIEAIPEVEITDSFYETPDKRIIRVSSSSGEQKKIEKTSSSSTVTRSEYGLKYSIAKEASSDFDTQNRSPHMLRKKKRTSFKITESDIVYQLDLTETEQTDNRGHSEMLYEVELELLDRPKTTIDKLSIVLTEIFLVYNNTYFIYSAQDVSAIDDIFSTFLPGKNPPNPHHLNIWNLFDGSIFNSSSQPENYSVSVKIDGLFCFMCVMDNGIYFLFRNGSISKVSQYRHGIPPQTIFQGELCRGNYYVFDLIGVTEFLLSTKIIEND